MIQPRADGKGLGRKANVHHRLQREGKADPRMRCQQGKKRRFPQDKIDDVELRSAQRLQNSNLPRSLEHSRVHRLEDDEKPTTTAIGRSRRKRMLKAGRCSGVIMESPSWPVCTWYSDIPGCMDFLLDELRSSDHRSSRRRAWRCFPRPTKRPGSWMGKNLRPPLPCSTIAQMRNGCDRASGIVSPTRSACRCGQRNHPR
jgi:hypothetical protein